MKIISLFIVIFSIAFGVEFCPEPTFIDEFEGAELSSAWQSSKNSSYMGSASLFSPTNVRVENGYLILSLKNIGTTDNKGNLYLATSGEVTSTLEFGYGKYEFRVMTRGLTAVTETLELLWDDGDYFKNHEYIGVEFQEKGFQSLLSVGIRESDVSDAFHSTEVDSAFQPVPLNLKPRFFTIEYLPDTITWYYDLENAVRQEASAVKQLPTHKMRVVLRNWLVEQLKYNITSKDMPIELKLDYFKFTPINEGKESCKKINLNSDEEEEDNSSQLAGNLEELQQIIDNIPEGENHLIGYSGEIIDLEVFKNVKVVWIYVNGEWKGYSPYSKIRATLTKHKIPIFYIIPPYTGFWIQK